MNHTAIALGTLLPLSLAALPAAAASPAPVDPPTATTSARSERNLYLRGDAGLFTAVGFAGATLGFRPLAWLEPELGVGVGPFGLQAGATLRLVHALGGSRLGFDVTYSVAPGAQVERDLVGGDYPDGAYQFVILGASYAYELDGGFLVTAGLGLGTLLDRPPSEPGINLDLLEEGDVLPTIRLGAGYAF